MATSGQISEANKAIILQFLSANSIFSLEDLIPRMRDDPAVILPAVGPVVGPEYLARIRALPLYSGLVEPPQAVPLPKVRKADRRVYKILDGIVTWRFFNDLKSPTPCGTKKITGTYLCAVNSIVHMLWQTTIAGGVDAVRYATRKSPVELRQLLRSVEEQRGARGQGRPLEPLQIFQQKLRAAIVLHHYEKLDAEDQAKMVVEEPTMVNGIRCYKFKGCGRTDIGTMLRTLNLLTCAEITCCTSQSTCQFLPQPKYEAVAALRYADFATAVTTGRLPINDGGPCQCLAGQKFWTAQVAHHGFLVQCNSLLTGTDNLSRFPFQVRLQGRNFVRGPFHVTEITSAEAEDKPGVQCMPHALAFVQDEEDGRHAWTLDDASIEYDVRLDWFDFRIEAVFYLPDDCAEACAKNKILPHPSLQDVESDQGGLPSKCNAQD